LHLANIEAGGINFRPLFSFEFFCPNLFGKGIYDDFARGGVGVVLERSFSSSRNSWDQLGYFERAKFKRYESGGCGGSILRSSICSIASECSEARRYDKTRARQQFAV